MDIVCSFSSMLIHQHCEDRLLKVGEIIMGHSVIESVEKYIVVLYNNASISNGSVLRDEVETRELQITLIPKVFQFVLEVSCTSCHFLNGKCGKRRRINSNGTLIIHPVYSTSIIEIRALWGLNYGTVYLSPIFVFRVEDVLVKNEL